MSNASLAAQAVADAQTAAPPSFDGHGWLVALNMGAMTAAFVIGCMSIRALVRDGWRNRERDHGWTPAAIWRTSLLLFALGITVRCGAEALVLWGWNPSAPAASGRFLTAKRFLDPIAVTFGLSGLGLSVASFPGVFEQLRKEPLPVDMWQDWPFVRRMLGVTICAFVMSIAVVSLR